MASALKKFKMLEQQGEEIEEKPPEPKPAKKKNKLSLYSHILSSFETAETADDKKRKTIERVRQEEKLRKQLELERIEAEKQKKEEELEMQRKQREEEEKRLKKEEEDRQRREEEKKREEEEAERRQKEWEKKEGKYAGLKPAAAMFQRALDAKGSVQKSLSGGDRRVNTLKKGTISEIRSKMFDQKSLEKSKSDTQVKPPPKKVIIPAKKDDEKNCSKACETKTQNNMEDKVINLNDYNKTTAVREGEVQESKCTVLENRESKKPEKVVPPEEVSNKRQSFISDFAALEKTYKILGISKEPVQNNIEEEKKIPSKKRHNSEGKIKNKDKIKTARKSLVASEVEAPKEESPKEPKVDMVLKLQNQAKKNFFQEQININKGLIKTEPELQGPRSRKKGSLINHFEQNTTQESDKLKRQSMISEEIKVDSQKFTTFLDKFESKDGREEAKAQMLKITKQQKEFERQKKIKEQKFLEEQEEIRRKKSQMEELAIQAALQEEMLQQQRIQEEEDNARIKAAEEEASKAKFNAVEEEFSKLEREEDEVAQKKKLNKKKKKGRKVVEQPLDELGPKLNLLAGDVSNTRSMFERNRANVEEPKEPQKLTKINKLTVNPFENMNTAEQGQDKEVKVNKLKRNSFMEQLEKRGYQSETKKKEPVKKISNEACIKFESKKEKKPIEDSFNNNNTERKPEVRASRSIEGPQQVNKNSKEKKTGSTMSLHKMFIEGPKEFFKSSKEKLYKVSKETLCEVSEKVEKVESQPTDKKPSRSEMQNYLLSHVLFDGKEVTKKEKPAPKKEEIDDLDDIENYLDDEYRAKIEQYCSLLEDDKPKRKKKKKAAKTKKQEEVLPKLKTVDVKAIQEQMKQQLKKPVEFKDEKGNESVFVKHESNVNKFKDMFDNEQKEEDETKPMLGQNNRRGRQGKSDIFSKIKALENAEKERLERERKNEERIEYLLQKELERQKENKIEQIEDEETGEEKAEDELKQNILQCLEDEVDNLEEEMRALDTQEQMIIDEEMQDDLCDENTDNVDTDDTHKVQLHEIHEEIVERKKNAADKKRKVLERFQHVLDANNDKERHIGKIVGKVDTSIFNLKNDNQAKKGFDDSVFVGVSDVMSKVKDKFEVQEEKQLHLLSRDDIKRKANPTALKYEMMANEEESIMSPTPKTTEWSWKNKTAAELESELSGYNDGDNNQNSSPEKKQRNFQDTRFNEMLNDINAVKERLHKRDLEKENEKKIQEMEELIDGVQESLKQHEEQYFDYEDEEIIEPKSVQPVRKVHKKKTKVEPVQLPKANKLDELKNQLLNKEEITKKDQPDLEVSVSKIKKQIIDQTYENDQCYDDLEQRTAKRTVSSNIISKLSEILPSDDKEDEIQLRKAPKMILKPSAIEDTEEAPAKTLEELKAEKQTKKWAWKEKDLSGLQNFINANDSIAPKNIVSQQKNLKELDEELSVVESIRGSNNANLLIQIREEKEKEFNEFMAGVQTYLTGDTKTVQEEEFKEGMKSYLDLIDTDKKDAEEEDKKPLIKLNSISKLKSSLLETQNEASKEKRSNNRVQKLKTNQIEAVLQQSEITKTSSIKENVIATDQTLLVKKMFEQKEKSPSKSPLTENKTAAKSSFAEKFAKRAREEKLKRMDHQLQYKQKTISDLHSYIENNERLATEVLLISMRECQLRKEDQKLSYHEKFMDNLNSFLKEPQSAEEQKIFMSNIRAYLTILDNVESTYNATPKLRKHKGVNNQSNMRRAIIEKSVERPKQEDKTLNKTEVQAEKKKELTPEEKRRAILAKYGFKDRSKVEVEDISDHEDEEELEVKDLTDKELAEKYHLPYVPDSDDLYRGRSDSVSALSILKKMRQVSSENQTQALSSSKKVFEKGEKSEGKELIKSPTVKLRKRFDSECEEASRGSSPLPSHDPGSKVTDKIKRRFEDHRRSLVDDEVDAINSFAKRNSIAKSGSTTKMKKLFEPDSPTTSRTSSPLLRTEPGSLVTSRLKQRFETRSPGSNRQSFIDDDSSAESRSCSPLVRALEPGSTMTAKLRSRFEGGATSPGADPRPAFSQGLQKSSTISDIGNSIQNSMGQSSEAQKMKNNLAEMYFKKEKVEQKVPMSPALQRVQGIEKSKSFSKFKNAFESGTGLNNDSSDDDDNAANQKSGIFAELEALRTSAQSKSSLDIGKTVSDTEAKKRELAASFFKIEKPKSTGMRSLGPVRSTTVSDIGAYLRSPQTEPTKAESKASPALQTKMLSATVQQEVREAKAAQSPQLGLQHTKSFSKFKNAFEDGRGVMDESSKPTQAQEPSQRRVDAELAALKSSSKIQNMFRINKSKSSPAPESPKTERRQSTVELDLDDDTMTEVARSRSAIADMFESRGPKITFGGGPPAEKTPEPIKPKPAPKKKEDENERKWVFDTIQKYFDVIVEDEEEEEDGEEEDEDGDDAGDEEDEENCDDSESDYTDAEDELPEIDLPLPRERSGTLPNVIPLAVKPKELPRLALPVASVQRASSMRAPKSPHMLRASTASPAALQTRKQPERKVSTLSVLDCIDDAAKQFDQLTDGSELSLDQSPALPRAGLQKSSSSSRIRGMLQSVVHGSNTSLNVSVFKSNLQTHLSNSRANSRVNSRCSSVAPRGSNLDPGVGEDSSSDYSEYD